MSRRRFASSQAYLPGGRKLTTRPNDGPDDLVSCHHPAGTYNEEPGNSTSTVLLLLIPEEAAPQFLDNAAPRNGMPPPDSEMIAPPITEWIPPGVFRGLAGAAVGLIRSPFGNPKGGSMPAERIGMRDAREIIRLKFSGVSTHEIARRLGLARSTVRETLKRVDGAGLSWPLPEGTSDSALDAALYASRRSKRGPRRIEEPDWAGVHRELKRKHVTLLILWDEYIAANPGGYSYSRFCELYRSFEKTLSVTMRQTHAAGERLFVDYAGDGVPVVIDRLTGEIRMAQIFVAVFGASSFTFAKATWTQALPDWIDAHVRAFEAIGGVPELVVPDNARTAIVKTSLYDPEVNLTYAEMAAHYRTAILPARPRKPRDKAKVEQAVPIVERWLLGQTQAPDLP